MQEIGEGLRLSEGLTKGCVFVFVYTSGSLCEEAPESPGSLSKARWLGPTYRVLDSGRHSVGLEWDLNIFILNKFLAAAAGCGTILGEPLFHVAMAQESARAH